MTIEQKINKILDKRLTCSELIFPPDDTVENWAWLGRPYSELHEELFKEEVDIDNLIKDCDEAECLTSPSLYIRQCKKYFMEIENGN